MDDDLCKRFDASLKDNKIVIISMQGCEPCKKAKNLLRVNNFEFLDIDITTDESIFECAYNKTRLPTVPQIFVNDKFIGGSTQLFEMFHSKKLHDEVAPKKI
jgi:glutaredoxin